MTKIEMNLSETFELLTSHNHLESLRFSDFGSVGDLQMIISRYSDSDVIDGEISSLAVQMKFVSEFLIITI